MAKDSISLIRQAEQQAQELIDKATAEAESIISQARIQAAEQSAEMITSAKKAAQNALDASREEGRRLAENDIGGYEERCRAVRAAAKARQSEAAELVIRRITE